MKNNSHLKEIIAAIGIIIILVILMDPLHFYYSNMMLASIITIFIILFVLFSVVVMQKKPADEREEKHQNIAGRSAFLAGTTVMAIGVIVQSFSHSIDPWLVVALGIMILTKLFTARQNQRNN